MRPCSRQPCDRRRSRGGKDTLPSAEAACLFAEIIWLNVVVFLDEKCPRPACARSRCWAARADSRSSLPRWRGQVSSGLSKGGAAVERVAAMGVSEPMRGDGRSDPCPLRGALQHVSDRALGQPPVALVRGEDRIIGHGVATHGQ